MTQKYFGCDHFPLPSLSFGSPSFLTYSYPSPDPSSLHCRVFSKHKIITTLLKTPYRLPIKLKFQTPYGSPESLGSTPADLLVPMPDVLPPVHAAPAPPAFSLLLNLLISLPGMFFSQMPPSHSLGFSLNPPPQKSLLGPHPLTLYYKNAVILFVGLSLSEMMHLFIFYLFSDFLY